MTDNLEPISCVQVANAIDKEDLAKVKEYIETGKVDVNCKVGSTSLLHNASDRDSKLPIVKYLVSKGGDIFSHDFEGNLPVHVACLNGAVKIFEYFINELKMDPNLKGLNDRNLLHTATEQEMIDLVKFLVEKTKIDLYAKDRFNRRSLDIAEFRRNTVIIEYLRVHMNLDSKKTKYDNIVFPIITGDLDGIRYFVETEGIDPNTIITSSSDLTGHYFISLLDYSVVVGNLNTVKYLISKKADFNIRDGLNNTCLHTACSSGHVEIVKYFIYELKMDANLKGESNQTLLHAATKNEKFEVLKFLIEEIKIDLYAKDDRNLRALEYAEQLIRGQEIVKLLKIHMNLDPEKISVDHGIFDAVRSGNLESLTYYVDTEKADINCIDPDKKSLLILAAEKSNFQIIKYLASKNIDILATDKSGRNALHAACENGQIDITRYFTIDLKMDPNSKDKWSKENCLHKAAYNGQFDFIKFVVENTKIDLYATNNWNETALQITHKRGFTEVEAYLKSKMKNLLSNFMNSKLFEGKSKRSNPQEISQMIENSKLQSSGRDNLRLENDKSNTNLRVQDVDLQSTMLLLNVLFRKFTNQKFITENQEPSLTEIKMIALNIIDSFEVVLDKISSEFNVSIDFDPTKLISSLTWNLRNGKFEEISKILISAVENDFELLKQNKKLFNQLINQLKFNIKKILLKELKSISPTKMKATSLSADSKLFFKNRLQPLMLERSEIGKIEKLD